MKKIKIEITMNKNETWLTLATVPLIIILVFIGVSIKFWRARARRIKSEERSQQIGVPRSLAPPSDIAIGSLEPIYHAILQEDRYGYLEPYQLLPSRQTTSVRTVAHSIDTVWWRGWE